VAQASAAALGVRELPGARLTATLVELLRDTALLLVLDNCEHLLDACAELVTPVQIDVPRDRDGSFAPTIVP